ncbi:MAG: GAF domain-containing protein [Ferruginibacter sp.]|nr:GAF domain-containing protein [Cytophagales bacterium]
MKPTPPALTPSSLDREEINLRADRIIRLFVLSFFVFGILIGFVYNTWWFAFGVGGLNLTLYLLARYAVKNLFASRLVVSGIFAVFMLQFIGQMHGMYEMHFFFFIIATILIIYQDWRVMVPYAVLTIAHHSFFFYLQLTGVAGMGAYFINAEGLNLQTLYYHCGLVAFHSAVCGWWAIILRRNSRLRAEDHHQMEKQVTLMKRNVDFVLELAKGDLAQSVAAAEQDELGHSLLNMRTNLMESQARDQQEKFSNLGLAEVGELLRANQGNPEELAVSVITKLVKYLNAQQGGVFVVQGEDEADPHINLMACYAYERRKHLKKRLEMGEGLVGQAIREQSTIYLTEVPNDYLLITSGLGGANPRSILILPLRASQQVVGAIELASFREFKSFEIAFLEKVAESLAATLVSVRVTQKTNLLLQESKQLTEQMHAQEEEMRQNVEELKATQEESERRLAEYQTLLSQQAQEISQLKKTLGTA